MDWWFNVRSFDLTLCREVLWQTRIARHADEYMRTRDVISTFSWVFFFFPFMKDSLYTALLYIKVHFTYTGLESNHPWPTTEFLSHEFEWINRSHQAIATDINTDDIHSKYVDVAIEEKLNKFLFLTYAIVAVVQSCSPVIRGIANCYQPTLQIITGYMSVLLRKCPHS